MSKPRILIVDDDEDLLTLLEMHFEAAGADVTKTLKPVEALEMVTKRLNTDEAFQLLIVDIRMPEMNGNELTRSLRTNGYDGPIVAFTASATGEGRREGTDAGITTYLSKDTLKKDLVEALLAEHCSD